MRRIRYFPLLAVAFVGCQEQTVTIAEPLDAPSVEFDVANEGVVFVINSANDVDDGACDRTHCSLREAINSANSTSGTDRIAFRIPGNGVHTIQPTSALPTITDPVQIDGYTQWGAKPNTKVGRGTNAILQIELDGSMAASGPPPPSVHGLLITAGGSKVRGLVINRFDTGDGIRLITSGGNVIEGNFIGTDVTGSAPLGNNRGMSIFSPDNRVGGSQVGAPNVLSGNDGHGVWLQDSDATGNRVERNLIGTAANGISPLGNAFDGIILTRGGATVGASDNVIGGAVGAGNTIAYNGRVGVFIQVGSARNAVLSNSIFRNGISQPPLVPGLGIDLLDPFGVSPNDVGDVDTGPNMLQNFPVLTSAISGSSHIAIEGHVNSTPLTEFRVEVFGNPDCDPSGHGEGRLFLGSANITTNDVGDASFKLLLRRPSQTLRFITATATDPDGNTSEFSECLEVMP